MTQRSRPWSGTTIGDSGPYSDNQWAATWRSELAPAVELDDDAGVIGQLNLLVATAPGAISPVLIDTGRADVQGKWFENDASVPTVIPTPAGAVRIDRLVARADYTAQTVRITRLVGVEGGAAPALIQVVDTTWDIPLVQISITVGGVITLTDQRVLIAGGGLGILGVWGFDIRMGA